MTERTMLSTIINTRSRVRVGQTLGRLTVIGAPFFIREIGLPRRTVCICKCRCGELGLFRADRLLKGNTTSCGCSRRESADPIQQAADPIATKAATLPAVPLATETRDGITRSELVAYFQSKFSAKLVARGVTTDTIKSYSRTLRLVPEFVCLDTITTWLAESGGSAATRNQRVRYLLAILRGARRAELIRGGWIEDVPQARIIKRVPRAWTSDEFAKLLAACDTLTETYFKIPARTWWRSFLLAMWYTGCRVDTLLKTKTGGFDHRDGSLLVESVKDRTEMVFSLPADAVAEIVAMRHTKLYLWPWPYEDHKKTMLRRMRELLRVAGLPQLGQPFHAIRKSVASYITNALGVHAAAEALHHCRPQITKDHYLDPRIVQPRISAGKVMPSMGNQVKGDQP